MAQGEDSTKSYQSLIHIDGAALVEPAKILVERVCDAVGGLFGPWQTRRMGAANADVAKMNADAEADAKLTSTMADIRSDSLVRGALARLAAEEVAKQKNMESVTAAALPLLNSGAKPDQIERDWLVNFFDKSRLTSDDEMQQLWAKILAGEANGPGKFSKRTINFMASLDKRDAELFQTLCRFNWRGLPIVSPIIFTTEHPMFQSHGLNWSALKHLDEIGLVSFESGLTGFSLTHDGSIGALTPDNWMQRIFVLGYGDSDCAVYSENANGALNVGRLKLSRVGVDIASVCGGDSVPGYFDYVVGEWEKSGARVQRLKVGDTITPASLGIQFPRPA